MEVLNLFKTVTFKQLGITFPATIINGGLGALFYLVAAKVLGAENFGILVVALTTLTLISDITDLGTGTGLVRFVGQSINHNRERAWRFMKLALELRVTVLILVAVCGTLLSPSIAELIFKKRELIIPLQLSMLGVGSALLFSFSTASFQALGNFIGWGLLQISTNAVRLLVILAIWSFGNINVNSIMMTFIALPMIGFMASLLFLPREFLKVTGEKVIVGEFFHYSKWVALFTILAAISSRLDTFISARLLSSYDLGVYTFAGQLLVVIPQIIGALNTVIAPKISSMGSKRELVEYLKKTQVMVLILAGVAVLLSPFALFLINFFYGNEYLGVSVIFLILLSAMLVFLVSIPIHATIFYYFGNPKLFVWVALGHLLIIAFLGWYMVMHFGAKGAAISVLIGMVFNLVVPAVWVIKKLRKND